MRKYTKTILVVVAVISAILLVAFFTIKNNNIKKQQSVVDQKTIDLSSEPTKEDQAVKTSSEPKKTDFGTNLPTDFPTDIPVEKGVKVDQSYSLNYEGQKQLTIVFPSNRTVKENYTLYEDFLKKQNWNISNKLEKNEIASLYGTKGSNDINVTISENTSATSMKSQVSISILKK